MTTTIGSVDLNALSDLYNDANQYFWFESNSDATYGAGVHITLSPDTSFVANPSGQNILMNTDGISIRNGLLPMMVLDNDSLDFNVINATTGTYNNVASFGSDAIVIGEEANANIHLTFNNLSMVDRDGTTFFEVGDSRNADGIATIKHTEKVTVSSAGSATVSVNSYISSIVSVYADSVQLSSSKYSFQVSTVTINGLTANSEKTIEITYTTIEPNVYLTLGDRYGTIGNYSVAAGHSTIASGSCSHAEGYMTTTSGSCSHAEGDGTTASGYCSHAGGLRTVADGNYMTAIGEYNTKNSGKAFVIGNGTRDTARSDAFAVDWSGNTVMKGGLTLGTALSIANGGTGATTVAGARNALGLGNTSGALPIANGGTGATTVAGARNALGLGNTSGALPIANGGTGATTVAGARNALGLGNTSGALPIANGGTGATTVAGARNALGLGNTSGALPIANGGTGATTAAAARTNLEVKKYTTKTFTSSSQSVSANTYKNIGFSISLDGYKPIGIIAINHSVFELAVIRFMCSSTDASVVLRNVTSKAKNVSVTITVLYEEA